MEAYIQVIGTVLVSVITATGLIWGIFIRTQKEGDVSITVEKIRSDVELRNQLIEQTKILNERLREAEKSHQATAEALSQARMADIQQRQVIAELSRKVELLQAKVTKLELALAEAV